MLFKLWFCFHLLAVILKQTEEARDNGNLSVNRLEIGLPLGPTKMAGCQCQTNIPFLEDLHWQFLPFKSLVGRLGPSWSETWNLQEDQVLSWLEDDDFSKPDAGKSQEPPSRWLLGFAVGFKSWDVHLLGQEMREKRAMQSLKKGVARRDRHPVVVGSSILWKMLPSHLK